MQFATSLLVLSSLLAFMPSLLAQQTCRTQFQQAAYALQQQGKRNVTGYESFIDPDTPVSACTIQLCTGDYAVCDPLNPNNKKKGIPKTTMILVYSDEFNKDGRKFGVKDDDKSWTAEDLYYFPTQDIEVYKPEQATTYKGNLVLTLERTPRPVSAKTQQPNGKVWDVPKNYKSAMLSGWNKWCFTGGYMEMNVRFPGSPYVSTYWPAFWAMGNLGRMGYMKSTGGFWPYSYSECCMGCTMNTSQPGSKVPSQRLSACPDPPGFDRTAYGMKPGVGRNAPEFDVFEGSTAYGPGVSQTLQMAPLLPEGTTWDNLDWYNKMGIPAGINLPGGPTIRQTELNGWDGVYGRPGNEFQDSYSGVSRLNASFYSNPGDGSNPVKNFHTFGVDWLPGEYLRWYIDGEFLLEINKWSLVQQTGPQNLTIGERIIPYEPMYMIMNLGLSNAFGFVDINRLEFPAHMLVDNVRVYQRPEMLNVGCSPPDMPTEMWIACHAKDYMTSDDDMRLIKTKCTVKNNSTISSDGWKIVNPLYRFDFILAAGAGLLAILALL